MDARELGQDLMILWGDEARKKASSGEMCRTKTLMVPTKVKTRTGIHNIKELTVDEHGNIIIVCTDAVMQWQD